MRARDTLLYTHARAPSFGKEEARKNGLGGYSAHELSFLAAATISSESWIVSALATNESTWSKLR